MEKFIVLLPIFTIAFLITGCKCSKPSETGLVYSIADVQLEEIDTVFWLLELNSTLGNNHFQFRYQDTNKNSLRMSAINTVQIGDLFFDEDPVNERFKLISVEEGQKRNVAPRFAIIEDQLPNKAGVRFKVFPRPRAAEKRQHCRFDHDVTFRVGAPGEEGETYTVSENESFTVSLGEKEYECKLMKVDVGERPNVEALAVEIEWTDGEKKTTRRLTL